MHLRKLLWTRAAAKCLQVKCKCIIILIMRTICWKQDCKEGFNMRLCSHDYFLDHSPHSRWIQLGWKSLRRPWLLTLQPHRLFLHKSLVTSQATALVFQLSSVEYGSYICCNMPASLCETVTGSWAKILKECAWSLCVWLILTDLLVCPFSHLRRYSHDDNQE